ncbi:MAG: glycyl-radical enzyme activating protein [Deltaproteobacteria bacterium]|nr:glycyl-radical enzyme activating protein [Deltaproteobacteria bacterium]
MSEAPAGRVFDVSRGRVDDGPGLRTVVFLKGCPGRCPWCHNPEGVSFAPEIAFDATRCIGCGECVRACPRNARPGGPGRWQLDPPARSDASADWRSGCTACGRCVDACPSRARRLAGRVRQPEELVRELLVDADFFAGTGGGVTFSGGEPLAQPAFLFAAAAGLRRAGVHVAVETAGLFPLRLLDRLTREVDLVLWDLKHVDAARLRRTIGRDLRGPLTGLRRLSAGSTPHEIRVTLVPGFNDGDEDLAAMARWLRDGPRAPQVRLLAFHRMAAAKQAIFGRPYEYAGAAATPPARLAAARDLLEAEGIPVRGGKARAPSPAG